MQMSMILHGGFANYSPLSGCTAEDDEKYALEKKALYFFRMIIDHFLIINVNEQILYCPPLWMLHVFRNDFCPKELHRK